VIRIIDPDQPTIPQIKLAVKKELAFFSPEAIVIGAESSEAVLEFLPFNLKTIFFRLSSNLDERLDEPVKEHSERFSEIQAIKSDVDALLFSTSKYHKSPFPTEVMTVTLKDLPLGVKRCVGVATLAVDRNFVKAGQLILSIAGSDGNPDTAILIEPQSRNNLIDTKIIKKICEPHRLSF
jgi:hypothetical protein